MSYFLYISLFIVGLYAITLLLLAVAWLALPEFPAVVKDPTTRVSVIIPARNEDENITRCIEHINSQNYPKHLVEIIVVDDHSTDNTCAEAEKALHKSAFNYSIIKLENNEGGKKAALTKGIETSVGTLVVTTDADSFATTPNWLRAIASYYEDKNSAMIIAPIVFSQRKGLLNAFQQIELFGLTLSTAGSAAMGKAIMCSGANLAFERSAFFAVNGYKGNEHVASGDDVFLLNKIQKQFPGKIHYLKSAETIVETSACASVNELLDQRVRWASKIKTNHSLFNFYLGAVVFLCNLLFVVFGAWSCFLPQLAKIFLLIAITKWIIDFLLVFLATLFLGHKRALWWFPVAMLINPIYVCVVSVLSLWLKPTWKGRKIN